MLCRCQIKDEFFWSHFTKLFKIMNECFVLSETLLHHLCGHITFLVNMMVYINYFWKIKKLGELSHFIVAAYFLLKFGLGLFLLYSEVRLMYNFSSLLYHRQSLLSQLSWLHTTGCEISLFPIIEDICISFFMSCLKYLVELGSKALSV